MKQLREFLSPILCVVVFIASTAWGGGASSSAQAQRTAALEQQSALLRVQIEKLTDAVWTLSNQMARQSQRLDDQRADEQKRSK